MNKNKLEEERIQSQNIDLYNSLIKQYTQLIESKESELNILKKLLEYYKNQLLYEQKKVFYSIY